MHILLVEDDRSLASGLQKALQKRGYVVNHVESGESCLHVVKLEAPDIVILDLGLPDMDGISVLKKIRSMHINLPVLLLTARSGIQDKVSGLDSGADDYLAKPFDMIELFARLRVLERRLGTAKTSVICIRDVCLDITSNIVKIHDETLELSRREYMLLKCLMENAGRVQSRSSLETRLYHWGEEVSSNALEVHIHHLRKKLGMGFIHTVRGIGYQVKQE